MNAPVDVSFFARAAKPLTSYRKYWAARFGTAPVPADEPRRDGRARLGQLRHHRRHRRRLRRPSELRHGGDRPHAGGAGLSRRHHRPARLAERRPVQGAGQAEPVLRRHRRQHGFDDQPLHGGPQDPQRRRLHARRRRRQAARPRGHRLLAALPRSVQATCRSCSAASKAACAASRITTTGRTRCAARSLVDAKCDLLLYGNAERAIVEIAHRLAASEPVHADHRRARHRLHAARDARGLVRDRLDQRRRARPRRGAHQSVPDDVGAGQGARARPAPRKTRRRPSPRRPKRPVRSIPRSSR